MANSGNCKTTIHELVTEYFAGKYVAALAEVNRGLNARPDQSDAPTAMPRQDYDIAYDCHLGRGD